MAGWKRWIGSALLAASALSFGSEAAAHYGLPNSIDHQTVIAIHRDSIAVDFAVYITEIAALIELREMNVDGDSRVSDEEKDAFFARAGDDLASGLELILDGTRLELTRSGGATLGMPFMKRYHYRAGVAMGGEGEHRLEFRDNHYRQVVGGRIIDFARGQGIVPVAESERDPRLMPGNLSEEMKEDPRSCFPFEVERWIVFRVSEESGAGAPPEGSTRRGPSSSPPEADKRLTGTYLERSGGRGRLERIIAGAEITPGLVVVAMLMALGLGAVHGLTPGHGKTIVAAYLVGSRGTPLEAVFLGIIVTLTHTISVFLLGIALVFARGRLPENYSGWLGFVSGCLIAAMGVILFVKRTRAATRARFEATLHDRHEHGHVHPLGGSTSRWGILSLGVSGGIIPCPEALAVLLLAFAVNRTLWGLLILVAFSIGLALVLVGIGLIMVTARRLAEPLFRSEKGGFIAGLLPGLSAAVIALLGLAIAIQSLFYGGIIGG